MVGERGSRRNRDARRGDVGRGGDARVERWPRCRGERAVFICLERRAVGASDERRAVRELARVDRDRANLDELAVLRAACVANLGAVRERRELTDRVERDSQTRESALHPHHAHHARARERNQTLAIADCTVRAKCVWAGVSCL